MVHSNTTFNSKSDGHPGPSGINQPRTNTFYKAHKDTGHVIGVYEFNYQEKYLSIKRLGSYDDSTLWARSHSGSNTYFVSGVGSAKRFEAVDVRTAVRIRRAV